MEINFLRVHKYMEQKKKYIRSKFLCSKQTGNNHYFYNKN